MADSTEITSEAMMADAELRALFAAAVDAIVVTDEKGKILAFSRSAEKLFGYCAADVIGKPVEMLMPEPHRTNHAEYMRRYLETGEARIIGIGRDVQAQRASGELFPITLSIGEALSDGRRRFVGTISDLTAKRAVEQRARSLETRLAHVGRVNVMGEMAAGIAHEINQPLSAIAMYAQASRRLLQNDPVDAKAVADICHKIEAQAHRAGQVMSNVRKFIRNQDLTSAELDVNLAIADVWNLVEADAHAEGIIAVVHYEPGLPTVRGDALQLQQVLLNLTRNSVDAMKDELPARGMLTVATSLGPDNGVRISVADTGPGVSGTMGENIFHPFVTTKGDGLGVGLSISRSIVQAYGGTLHYEDNPEGGAIFMIDLLTEAAGGEAHEG